jgi:pimeloyl-ACP methyl ester carboxylesterase
MSDRPTLDDTRTADDPAPASRRRGLPVFATLLAVALVAGLMTGVIASRSDDAPPELTWTPVDGGLEEATLTVPVDHDSPDGATLELQVLRRPADDPTQRIGSLLVNPGGPGFGAEVLIVNAGDVFGTELLTRFDIVGMDPRGTGGSTPAIDCIDDYDAQVADTDITPTDEAERNAQMAQAAAFATACIDRTGVAIAHMTTAATARDVDALRRALDEETITFFGMSYGCTLGATWVTLFPETVRAAVLDGCPDPTADPAESIRQSAAGFQASVEAFLAMCTAVGSECPIPHGGDPADSLRELWARAGEGGIPSLLGRPPVNESVLQTATVISMYSEDIWPTFAMAIATGLDGDGSLLTLLADAYTQRRDDGTWGNELEAFTVIECMDATVLLSVDEQAALNAELAEIAPLVYPAGMFSVSICGSLPDAGDEPVTITGAGAPTVLVLGNTGDPATPFASTEAMVAVLESAVLIAIESMDHGGYGTNDCVDDAVHRYLVDGVIPAAGTRC